MAPIIPLIIFLISLLLIGLILVAAVACCILSLLPAVLGIIKKRYGWGIGGFLICHAIALPVTILPGLVGLVIVLALAIMNIARAFLLLALLVPLLFTAIGSAVSVILCGLICGGSMVLIFRRSKKAVEAAQ